MEKVIRDLENAGFEIVTLEDLHPTADEEIISYMNQNNANVILNLPTQARFWYFTSVPNMVRFFEQGGKVDINNPEAILA